ncbi:MAG: hypothetical protein JNK82_18750 [Myxococcaceae bacterium]|nr:hypothetical protein [Myxococcaceae bacterium]
MMFEAHYDFVLRVLRRSGLSAAAADDRAQAVFSVATKRSGDIAPGRARAFLCATALRVVRGEGGEAVVDAGGLAGRRRLLDAILAEMEEDLRTVLVLTEIEGLSKRDVALALEIPEGTAASRLRRARADFRERLRRGSR